MIGRLHGTLIEKHPPHLLIDVQGVGYEVQVSMNTFSQLPAVTASVTLHIHHVIREDTSLLFGFLKHEERKLFRHLIKISGIGPKIALAILSTVEPAYFIVCIKNQDVKSLTRLPGIGKKTAERLLIEMGDRLTGWQSTPSTLLPQSPSTGEAPTNPIGDAVEALIALGYKAASAQRMIATVAKEEMACAEMIRLALQSAGGR